MDFEKMERRQLLIAAAGAGFASLIPSVAVAQQTHPEEKQAFQPDSVGRIHNRVLEEISGSLKNAPMDTVNGLEAIVDLLVKAHIVNEEDASRLRNVAKALLDPASMARVINRIYADAKNKASEVTVAIISIAQSSIEYAKNNPETVAVVASDFGGAMSGVLAVVEGGPVFWVAGALAGGVGASALTYSKIKRS